MTLAATLLLPSVSSFAQFQTQSHLFPIINNHPKTLRSSLSRSCNTLLASRRSRDFSHGYDDRVDDPRNWSRQIAPEFVFDEDDDEDEEEEDRSLDLLVRFVENVFRKISKRARKAVRSVLPLSISTKLVGFSVNGVLILAFLWILKAFLEVICTLGTVVFTAILLIRGLWAGVNYIQVSRRHNRMNDFEDDPRAWSGFQPAS